MSLVAKAKWWAFDARFCWGRGLEKQTKSLVARNPANGGLFGKFEVLLPYDRHRTIRSWIGGKVDVFFRSVKLSAYDLEGRAFHIKKGRMGRNSTASLVLEIQSL